MDHTTPFTTTGQCHICGQHIGPTTEIPTTPTPNDHLIADEVARLAASAFWKLRSHVRGFHGQF